MGRHKVHTSSDSAIFSRKVKFKILEIKVRMIK